MLLASMLFGIVGIGATYCGLAAIKNRQGAIDAASSRNARPFILIWAVLTLSSGLSMLIAAALVWEQWKLALILGLWPILFFAALGLGRIVRVDSHLSSGEADDSM